MSDRNPSGGGYDDDDQDGGGFDLTVARDYLGYAINALRLHRWVALAVTLIVAALGTAVILSLPKTYHVESKLFAQQNAGVETRPIGGDPLKGIAEIIKGHDSLAALVTQLDLVTWSREHLAPAQRLKAFIVGSLGRTASDEERAKGLIGVLSTDMNVWQSDATATITLDWSDAVMAARIVDTAEQNFLEKRHVMEISTIAESVSILEEHAAKLRSEIEGLANHGRPADANAAGAPPAAAGGTNDAARSAAAVSAVRRVTKKRPETDAELARLKVMIDTKQRAIGDLEQFRQRRLLDLQSTLAEQRSKYTDAHPIIVGLKDNIAATSKESPEVTSLRTEMKGLQDKYDAALRDEESPTTVVGGAPGAAAPGPAGASPSGVNELAALLLMAKQENRDPAVEAQIGYAVAKYSEIRTQISTARIDLDLAQAAFRYRYSVVVPPEPPLAPIKPKVSMLIAATFLLALLLGILAAVGVEVRSGRVLSRWQIERLLKVPVLAELPCPVASKPQDPS